MSLAPLVVLQGLSIVAPLEQLDPSLDVTQLSKQTLFRFNLCFKFTSFISQPLERRLQLPQLLTPVIEFQVRRLVDELRQCQRITGDLKDLLLR